MMGLNTVRGVGIAAALAIGLGASATAHADNLELRVATLAPPGSSWMKILDEGAVEVSDKTEQRITVKYYAGGVQGDERDVVRKIRLGQLEGAAVTSVGLAMIDESVRVLELPRMFASIEEMDYVREKMWPYFQKKFEKAGFRLGEPGDVGWIYFMSANKVESLSDLRSQKVWMWGDDGIVRAMFKKLNVSGVPLGVPEVDAALTSGRINACYGSPLAAVALQWSTKVKYMTSMPMSYAIGATIISNDAWKKLGAEDAKTFEKTVKKIGKNLRKTVRKDNTAAQKQMTSKGVTLVNTPATMIADFDTKAEEVWKELAGKVYSQDELDMVLKYRQEYRDK